MKKRTENTDLRTTLKFSRKGWLRMSTIFFKRRKLLCISIASLIGIWLLFFSSYANAEEDWTLYGVTKYLILYYNPKSITHPLRDIVRLWIKSVSKCNVREEWAVKSHPNCSNVEWVYVLTLTEINCSTKKDRDVKSIGYAKAGTSEESLPDETSPWADIVPDSYAEVLYKSICPPLGSDREGK